MKLVALLGTSSILAASTFGVAPAHSSRQLLKKPALVCPLNKADASPLFRDPTITRGGAVPGWAAYNEALEKKPLITKALTSLVGWALGDLLAQVRVCKIAFIKLMLVQFFISGGPFDMKRFITLSIFRFIYHGPSGHYFCNWLDEKIPGTTGALVAAKVAIDRLLWCPVFMTVFFTYLGLANGDSMNAIVTKIKNDLFTAV